MFNFLQSIKYEPLFNRLQKVEHILFGLRKSKIDEELVNNYTKKIEQSKSEMNENTVIAKLRDLEMNIKPQAENVNKFVDGDGACDIAELLEEYPNGLTDMIKQL